MIPRIFHQIWLGDGPLPREYEGYQRSWTKHNPGWELRVWTEADLLGWLTATQDRNARVKQSHMKRRLQKLRKLTL